MLEIKNLSKSFSSTKVLDDISCSIELGKLVALTGKNGSGKTTFLKCISNIMNTDNGKISYRDSQFLFLNDKSNIFSDLTIKNNLKCILRFYNQKINKDLYSKYISLLGLEKFENLPLKNLSKGNLQRNKLFIALNVSWEYLLIDEPLVNLDHSGKSILKEIFLKFKSQNKTVIFSTHNFSYLSDICDECFEFEKGKLVHVN